MRRFRPLMTIACLLAATFTIDVGATYALPLSLKEATRQIPPDILERGTLRVGTNLPFAPMEFLADDGTTFTGVDIDLITEAAKRLGLTTEFVNINWDGLIPAMNSGRFEVVAASVADFEERRGQADFVDYLRVGVSAVVLKTDPDRYTVNSDLCGKRVGGAQGSATVTIATALADRCEQEGKQRLTIDTFPGDNEGLLALRSRRIDAHLVDAIVADYQASTEEGKTTFRSVLPDLQPDKMLYGFALGKNSRSLTHALAAALETMREDGTYKAILDKYGVGAAAIDQITINAGGSQGE